MSLNSNYTHFEPPKSDLLQKYLMQTNSAVQIKTNVQNTTPAIQNTPGQDTFVKKQDNKKDTKKAKIAAASLSGTLLLAGAVFLGKTNAGRKLVKKASTLAGAGYEKILQKLRDAIGGEKVDNAIRKFYNFRDNKLAKLNAIPENIVNGKDVFSRNTADIVTGRRLDTSNMTGFKKKAAEAYKATVGRVLSWFHLLDKHSTKLYESQGIQDGVKKYAKTSKKYSEYSTSTLEEIKKALNANPDKKFTIAGEELTGKEVLVEIENRLKETGDIVTNLTGKAESRMWGYNNGLKGLNEEGKKVARSLTEETSEAFMERIKGGRIGDLLTEPVAGGLLKDRKDAHAKEVKKLVDTISKTTRTVAEDNIGEITKLKGLLGTADIDTYTEIDKTLRVFDRYRNAIFDGSVTSTRAQEELCGKLDDLIAKITQSNNPNGAKAIETLNGIKTSIMTAKGGKTEEIMDIARQVLDNETYNGVVLPKYKQFQKTLNNAYHTEVLDILDKLRDTNCGCAPTDFMTVMGSVGLMGVYTAQAENNDERVSLTLSTGVPIVSTVATNVGCAIKSISGSKAMAVSLAVGGITKFICDKINKAFRKSKGLDNNDKPSVVTIDDYLPYKNKFGELFMLPPDANM